jgi:hypothetical protein
MNLTHNDTLDDLLNNQSQRDCCFCFRYRKQNAELEPSLLALIAQDVVQFSVNNDNNSDRIMDNTKTNDNDSIKFNIKLQPPYEFRYCDNTLISTLKRETYAGSSEVIVFHGKDTTGRHYRVNVVATSALNEDAHHQGIEYVVTVLSGPSKRKLQPLHSLVRYHDF